MDDLQRLGDRLRLAREKRGWNQRELARRAGVANSAVSRLETNDAVEPAWETIVKLATALDCSLDYLSGREPGPDSELMPANAAVARTVNGIGSYTFLLEKHA